jgi:alkylation response protein AidB-like acyl-CoA dehydrogenase
LTEAFLAEVRAWLAGHVPAEPLPSLDTAEGFERHRAWERELAAARLAVVPWPARYGGRDASLAEWLAFEEEYYAVAAPARVGQNGLFMLAPTLFAFGTAEQCDRILPRISAADDIWAQAWSEPEAGSDLAAIRSGGVRTEGAGWCPGPRPGARGRRSPTGRSGCSAPIPAPSAERLLGLPR